MNAPHPATFKSDRRFPFWALVVVLLIAGHFTLLAVALLRATGPGGIIVIESTQQPEPPADGGDEEDRP